MKKLTKEVFAQWSFENDRENDLYEPSDTWESLPKDEKSDYLKEAAYYFQGKTPQDLPLDIQDRAIKEGYSIY